MNRNRLIFCKSALACTALAALLGGPRLCEASNDFSRRIAEQVSKSKKAAPADSGSHDKQDDTRSFNASPEVCVAKPDSDGRGSMAIDVCDRGVDLRPIASHLIVNIRHWSEPVVSLHAPHFNATAPPASAI